MTQAKAATVASALITAGYAVQVERQTDGTYEISVHGVDISPSAVSTFASNNTITATVSNVKFV